jgi:hypothetical protein
VRDFDRSVVVVVGWVETQLSPVVLLGLDPAYRTKKTIELLIPFLTAFA